MRLRDPFLITARLMPGVLVGGAFISLGIGPRNQEGRVVYECYIDLPDGFEHEVTDFHSGVGGGSVQSGMENLLGFLEAAAESYGYRMRTGNGGENEHLFPLAVVQWAHENADEISVLRCIIEEMPDLITD